MESQKTTYRNLAAIEILHHHFLDKGSKTYESGVNDLTAEEKAYRLQRYDLRDWLTIEASNESKLLMARLGVRYKISPLSIQLFTEVDSNNKPLKSLDDLRLEFDVQLNPSIAPFTALAHFAPGQYYLFSNQQAWLNANASGSLCQAPLNFDTTKIYAPGEIIESANKHYMAAKAKDNINKALNDQNFWIEVDHTVAFANGANFVQANSRDRPGIAFKVAISGQKEMGDFSLTSTTNVIQNRVFKIHLNKI